MSADRDTAPGADACRIDVWLWRARFFKTRSLAARVVEAGRVRLTRDGVERRLDKASRGVRPGDGLVFALEGELHVLTVLSLGVRRGPAAEARALYAGAADPPEGPPSGFRSEVPAVDKPGLRLEKSRAPKGGREP